MDRLGFIDFNTWLSMENSRKAAIKREQTKACFQYAERKQARPEVKASSYAQAIRILDAVLVHQHVVDLHGQSLYDIRDLAVLEQVWEIVKDEVRKMKEGQPNIFDYGTKKC